MLFNECFFLELHKILLLNSIVFYSLLIIFEDSLTLPGDKKLNKYKRELVKCIAVQLA